MHCPYNEYSSSIIELSLLKSIMNKKYYIYLQFLLSIHWKMSFFTNQSISTSNNWRFQNRCTITKTRITNFDTLQFYTICDLEWTEFIKSIPIRCTCKTILTYLHQFQISIPIQIEFFHTFKIIVSYLQFFHFTKSIYNSGNRWNIHPYMIWNWN